MVFSEGRMRRVRGEGEPVVSILTPSIPERRNYLRECEASVRSQTDDRWEHLVQIDRDHEGCSITMNRLAAAAHGDWIIPLADDDLLLPGCIEAMLAASADADVVYAPPLVTGNEDRWWFFQAPPVIPSVGLIRRSLWDKLGGYDESLIREEDRSMWVAALEADAVFKKIDYPCWVYRQHESNKSFHGGVAA